MLIMAGKQLYQIREKHMQDYILLKKGKLYKSAELIFVDIKTNDGFLFDRVAKDMNLKYKSKGFFVRDDAKEYVIRNLTIKEKDLEMVERTIVETHKKALILGYNKIDRWKEILCCIMRGVKE